MNERTYTVRTEFGVMRGVLQDEAEVFLMMSQRPPIFDCEIIEEPKWWEGDIRFGAWTPMMDERWYWPSIAGGASVILLIAWYFIEG